MSGNAPSGPPKLSQTESKQIARPAQTPVPTRPANGPPEGPRLRPPSPPVGVKIVDISEESARLSERFSRIEAQLAQLPWKMKAEVDIPQGFGTSLCFWRTGSGLGWSLLLRQEKPDGSAEVTYIKDCSVADKREAAESLPALIDEMRRLYVQRADELSKGHAALDDIERRLFGVEMREGV